MHDTPGMTFTAIPRHQLIEEFGAGWDVDMSRKPNRLLQVLSRGSRRLPQAIGLDMAWRLDVVDLPTTSAEMAEAHRVRRQGLLDVYRGRLARLDTDNGHRAGVLPSSRSEHLRMSGIVTEMEAEIAQIEAGLPVVPLPEVLNHYGRLPFGAPAWLLDTRDEQNGFPIHPALIAAERHPEIDYDNPGKTVEFQYMLTLQTDPSEPVQALKAIVDSNGVRIPASRWMSLYTDHEQAIAARARHIAGLTRRDAAQPAAPMPAASPEPQDPAPAS